MLAFELHESCILLWAMQPRILAARFDITFDFRLSRQRRRRKKTKKRTRQKRKKKVKRRKKKKRKKKKRRRRKKRNEIHPALRDRLKCKSVNQHVSRKRQQPSIICNLLI
jgi:DNA invertase Pin-like site-specific DNA recombinase